MNIAMQDFSLIAPEIFVLSMACVILMVHVFVPNRNSQVVYLLSQLSLVGAFFLTMGQFEESSQYAFNHMFISDDVSHILKLSIYATAFFAFIYGRDYLEINKLPRGEYYVLGLFAVLGMMVLVSAASLLVLYLGLELLSLPLYAMVAMRRDNSLSSEAAVKYFVMGALASGILLYGMSMIYGGTNSLDLHVIANVIAGTPENYNLIMIFGMVFVVVGGAFKLGAVPFHMWVPDVYQGAPVSVTTFLSSAPKLAAFGLLIRVLVDGMPQLAIQWQELLMVLAVLSMALGNILAIAQSNIKRMLGYSGIAHIGYMLLGLTTGEAFGFAASLFYVISYAVMSVAAFGFLTILSRSGVDVEEISDLRGLNSRNPWLAFMMLLVMFSMAGIPPLVGFFAKMGVIEALIRAQMVWLAAIALVFAVIGAYYYIRVVKYMYFDDVQDKTPLTVTTDSRLAISLNGLVLLLLGLFPSALITLCRTAFGVSI